MSAILSNDLRWNFESNTIKRMKTPQHDLDHDLLQGTMKTESVTVNIIQRQTL